MAASRIEHTFMMTLDHVGDLEAMVHAQLGQQPLAHTTETSLQPRQGTRSCLSAQPPALAFWIGCCSYESAVNTKTVVTVVSVVCSVSLWISLH